MNARPRQPTARYQLMAWSGVVVAITAIVGCNQAGGAGASPKSKSSASQNAPRVQTVTVQPKDLTYKIELPGTVEGYETADLYAKVGGFLADISVDIGDHVTKGQVLARLSIPEMERELQQEQAAIAAAEADVEQSKAALHEAKTELREKEAQLNQQLATFERTKDLVDRGSLQQKLLDEAMYQRDAAVAALETVKARLRQRRSTARTAKRVSSSQFGHAAGPRPDRRRSSPGISTRTISPTSNRSVAPTGRIGQSSNAAQSRRHSRW
jgi:HlyD family secretion protein